MHIFSQQRLATIIFEPLSSFRVPHIHMPRDMASSAFVASTCAWKMECFLGPRLNVQLLRSYYMAIRVLNRVDILASHCN